MTVKPYDETGEGNRKADQRYRKGVRETVKRTDVDELAEQARHLSGEDLKEARRAEDDARSPARK